MTLSLKERFARLGPVKGIDLVRGGSPAVISLRVLPGAANLKTISAVMALVRRGVPVLRAKRAVEEVLDRGCVAVLVPNVENAAALAGEIADAGFLVTRLPEQQAVG
jgi:putative transcriptional regulator